MEVRRAAHTAVAGQRYRLICLYLLSQFYQNAILRQVLIFRESIVFMAYDDVIEVCFASFPFRVITAILPAPLDPACPRGVNACPDRPADINDLFGLRSDLIGGDAASLLDH